MLVIVPYLFLSLPKIFKFYFEKQKRASLSLLKTRMISFNNAVSS